MNKYPAYLLTILTFFLSVNSTIEATGSTPSFYYKVDATVSNVKPKLYEPVTISCKITSDRDIDKASIILRFDGVEVITDIKPIGFYAEEIQLKKDVRYYGKKGLIFNIKKGEIKEFSAVVKFIKKPSTYNPINFGFSVRSSDRNNGWGAGGWNINYSYLDPSTGLLGTRADYEKTKYGDLTGIEYRYDPVDAVFYQNPIAEFGPMNKRLIAMMKKIEPALSDSEALLLHSDFFSATGLLKLPVGVELNNVEKGAAIGEECEGVFRYMLNDGWLKAARSGKRLEWLKKEKGKVKKQWDQKGGGTYIYPFPDSNIGDYSISDPKGVAITFSGNWHFKDHQYNKDQGLLPSAVDKHVSLAKARVFLYYWYSGSPYRRVTYTKVWTSSDGSFTVIDNLVPPGSTLLKAGPVIYPSGPTTDEQIKITDPNIVEATWWKDKDDSTLFVMRELGNLGATILRDIAANVSGDINYSFGDVWTDTFPRVNTFVS